MAHNQKTAGSTPAPATKDTRPWRKWYKLARWQKRRQALFSDQPLCVKCLERDEVTIATTADHIIPHRGNPDLFWYGDLQPLCSPCHSMDKQREELGQTVVTFGPDGWPV